MVRTRNCGFRWILRKPRKTAPCIEKVRRKKRPVHRPALFLLLAVFVSPLARAQEPKDKIACFDYRKDNAPYRKNLWDGYEISLGPSRNPDAVEDKCTGAIYNSAGKVVFRTSGFSVVFDEDVTGKDFDGDGKPEVVFRTD